MEDKKLTFADLAKMGQEQNDPKKNTENATLLADMFGVPQVQDMKPIPAQQYRGLTRGELEQQAPTNLLNKIASSSFISDLLKNNTASLDKSKLTATTDSDIPISMQYPDSNVPENKAQPVAAAPQVSPTAMNEAPVSNVKKAFQQTQSPEQKLIAQQLADSQNPLVDNEMKKAMEAAQQNREAANFNSMMADLSNGIIGQSGVNAKDNRLGFLDRAIANADAPVSDLNIGRDQYKKFLNNKEELEKADPNSAVSKTMRDALSGMGVKIPANASYSTMEKLAPQLMANQQFKERMADRALQREMMLQNKQLANDTKSNDKQNSYLQFATNKTAPIRAAYSTIQAAAKLASSKSSNPAEDITTLYSFVKNLDPNSSVREGEVGLARDIASVQGKVSTYFNKIQNGDSLDTKTVDNLKKEIIRLAKSQKHSYDTEMSAYKAGAKNRGISEDRFNEFDPYGNSQPSESLEPKTNKPKTIKQNGHTYTLNESTGEYE